MTHTIYVIDDNIFVREALAMLIDDEPDLAFCGAAESATEALAVILQLQPDLVLTDYSMRGMNGVELIERLGILLPEQRVAVLSAHVDRDYVDRALGAGATGYILKDDATAILDGIRSVLVGDVYVSPSLSMSGPFSIPDSE